MPQAALGREDQKRSPLCQRSAERVGDGIQVIEKRGEQGKPPERG